MTELIRALSPVRKRMRERRAFSWALCGLCAGAAGALLLRAASFLWPFANVGLWIACSVAFTPLLSAAIGFVWPVSHLDAARKVDSLGLQARAQTALMLENSSTPMAELQRRDTLKALSGLSVKAALPLKAPKAAWIALLTCGVALAASFLLPNPQKAVLQARAAFQAEMKQQAELVDKGAAGLDAKDAETPELRKLLGDLSRELRQAEEPRAALSAADDAERKIAALQKATAKETKSALENAGLSELARALEREDAASASELLQQSPQSIAEKLSAAAQSATNHQAAQALSQAAQAMKSGNAAQALGQLSAAATGQCSATMQAAALANMARSAAMRASMGQAALLQASGMSASGASGKSGTGAGLGAAALLGGVSGAGSGSSNKDGGYHEQLAQASVQGSANPEKKTGEYEAIYDPTRLGGDGEVSNERGQLSQGETSEAVVGTGVGSVGESVPYNRVLPQYQQSAAQAAENADLPSYAQKWVETYFALLAE